MTKQGLREWVRRALQELAPGNQELAIMRALGARVCVFDRMTTDELYRLQASIRTVQLVHEEQ